MDTVSSATQLRQALTRTLAACASITGHAFRRAVILAGKTSARVISCFSCEGRGKNAQRRKAAICDGEQRYDSHCN